MDPAQTVSPNYSFSGSYQPPAIKQIRTPMAGLAEMAQALISGNAQYQQQQAQNAPMQLQGAQPNPGTLNGLFGPSVDQTQMQPDPSSPGYYTNG